MGTFMEFFYFLEFVRKNLLIFLELWIHNFGSGRKTNDFVNKIILSIQINKHFFLFIAIGLASFVKIQLKTQITTLTFN